MLYLKTYESFKVELPIMYHGTNYDFNKFDLNFFNFGSADGGWLGKGIYFTNDYNYAKSYANEESGRVIKAKLSPKNPYLINNYQYSIRAKKLMNDLGVSNSRDITNKLTKSGYDSVLLSYKDDFDEDFYEICVFNLDIIEIVS